MIYFIRSVVLYLFLFIAASLLIQHWFQGNQLGDETIQTVRPAPSFKVKINETASGLMLAGTVAQNRRDWALAGQIFSKLNEKYSNNPQLALRAMTLALGNADYAEASTIARMMDKTYLQNDNMSVRQDAFDFVHLFLVLMDIKNKNYMSAKQRVDFIEKSSLSEFVIPNITKWMESEQKDEKDLAVIFKEMAFGMYLEYANDSALLFARLANYLHDNVEGAYDIIGQVLYMQGQDAKALDAFSKVKESDEHYQSAIGKWIDILMDDNQLEAAKNVLLEKIDRSPDTENTPYLYYLLGNVHRENKDYENAINAYDIAETMGLHNGDLNRELWPLYYSRAIAFDLMNEWEKSEADLKKAMEKFPENPLILNYIGYAYADRGVNLEQAREMISRAVMAAPNDPYIIDSMGWILYRMGRYDQALPYLERAGALKPYHMVINDHLGDVYWKVGRKLEAYYMWQRAIEYYDPTDEEQRRTIDETRRKVTQGLD